MVWNNLDVTNENQMNKDMMFKLFKKSDEFFYHKIDLIAQDLLNLILFCVIEYQLALQLQEKK
jgi:hypothetical protein